MAGNGTVDVIIQQQAIDNIAKANAALEVTLKNIIAINEASRKGSSTGNNPNSAANINKANAASTERLKIADQTLVMQKKLVQAEINLSNATTKTNKAIIQNRVNLQQTNKRLKESAILSSKLTSSLQKAQVVRNRLAKTVQDLNVKRNLGNKLTKSEERLLKRSTAQFRRYDSAIKKSKESVNRFQESVGNYQKGLKGLTTVFRNLIGVVGIFQALRMGFTFAKEARQLGIEAKGVEFAFKNLGDGAQSAFDAVKESTRGLLSDLDIQKNIILFDNFNISLEQMGDLMEFAAVRAAQTGESMEHLASSIATGLGRESVLILDNLGINTKELRNIMNDLGVSMTEAFSILASREVKEAGNILGEAANAQAKWNADLENFQVLVGRGFISRASDAMFAFGSNILRAITPTVQLSDAVREEQLQLNILAQKTTDVNITNEEREKRLDKLIEKYPGFLGELDKEKVSNEDIRDRLQEVNRAYVVKIALMDLSQEVNEKTKESSDKLRIAFEKEEKARIKLNELLGVGEANRLLANRGLEEAIELALKENGVTEESIKINEKLERQGTTLFNSKQKELLRIQALLQTSNKFEGKSNDLRAEANDLQERLNRFVARYSDVLEDVNNLTEEGVETSSNLNEVAKKTIAHYNEIIRTTKELRDSTAETNAEYESFNQTILDAENGIQRLKVKFKELIEVQSVSATGLAPVATDPVTGEPIARTPQVTETEGSPLIPEEGETLARANDTFLALADLGDMLFERRIAQIDAEIQANEEKYNLLFLMAEGDAEQQRLLAIQEEKERQVLEKKKRKEQKKQAVLNKAVAITQAGINTALAITSALTFVYPASLVFAALAAATGAAQIAAIVASPIPQFAKGGTMDKDGLAIVGDGGRKEVIKNPDGSIQVTPNKSTVVGLQKGAEIFPSIDAFNQEIPTDISDQIYSATVMASLSINNAQMKGYMQAQRVLDEKLLDAMLLNTQAIKKQKLSVNNRSQRVDLSHDLYKMRYSE